MQKTELPFIREMFDKIAPRYDLLNHLLSLGQDILWRKALASELNVSGKGKVLDVACGTGEIGLEILRQKNSEVSVFGLDFSINMLMLAAEKIKDKAKEARFHLSAGDAFYLPFKDNTFDAVTIAFGIRNLGDKLSALKSFHNSLKPGGMLLILELSTPRKGLLLNTYLLYFKKILPLIGWFFSKNLAAYQYLTDSVINFPRPEKFADIMVKANFSNVRWKGLTSGVVNLFIGHKE
jgi:demethylmenaquinone methyltransferase/2-methoxy-6-polyprenyl-1,4-benzoquinol methylase